MTANGGDGVDMNTAATNQAMSALAAEGDTLRTAWSAAADHANQLEAQLGRGPLGQRFAAGYQPGATQLRQNGDVAVGAPGRLAGVGQQCVADYTNADARSCAGLLSRTGNAGS